MSALARTSPAALIPAATGALAQLQPVMVQTQRSVQELTATVMKTTDSYEKRCQQLETENIALKAQIATVQAVLEARQKAQDEFAKTFQSTVAALQKEVAALKKETSYLGPAIEAMVAQGGAFSELDYPGKDKVVAAREPILEAEIAAARAANADTMGKSPMQRDQLRAKLTALELEAAKIAAFKARAKA